MASAVYLKTEPKKFVLYCLQFAVNFFVKVCGYQAEQA